MELLANGAFGYLIMDCSQHTMKHDLNDQKTHAVIYSKIFEKLNHVNTALIEVELTEVEIEHKEPIIFGFFRLRLQKSTTFYSLNFEMYASLNCWRWIQFLSIMLLPRRNWKIASDLK